MVVTMPSDNKNYLEKEGVLPRFLVIKAAEALWQGKEVDFTHSKGYKQLRQEDKGFAKLLYLTFIRTTGQCDALIDSLVLKKIEKKNMMIRDILRLGIVQHHFLKTSPYAIVTTALHLIDHLNQKNFKPFVHAVLSKIIRNEHAFLIKETGIDKNFPEWMFTRWRNNFGLGKAQEIAFAFSREAPIDFTIKTDPDLWPKRLGGTLIPFNTIRSYRQSIIESLEGYHQGEWWIQDWSSSLPIKLLNPIAGKKALDLCAAPGGKTAQLIAKGLNVTSIDNSNHRLKRLHENLKRLKMHANVIQDDATTWKSKEKFDYVLIDAPCSGTGTYRRHPERRFLRKENDFESLLMIQEKILQTGIKHLADDGILMYCTCSLEKEENEQQIEKILKNNETIERIPFTLDEVQEMKSILTPLGDIQILPFELSEFGGADGFFIARLKKR